MRNVIFRMHFEETANTISGCSDMRREAERSQEVVGLDNQGTELPLTKGGGVTDGRGLGGKVEDGCLVSVSRRQDDTRSNLCWASLKSGRGKGLMTLIGKPVAQEWYLNAGDQVIQEVNVQRGTLPI